jgi:hypothetical protein
MKDDRVRDYFHLQFAPEHWSSLQTLRSMLGDPLPTTTRAYEGLDACLHHQNKVVIFARLAQRIVPDLPKDREQLEATGASDNIHSAEFGALLEAMLCEMYSSLDGLAMFLCEAFPRARGLQCKSNEKLFRRAAETGYGDTFPEEVRKLLAEAYGGWFPRLRSMRKQITHSTGGFFYLDKENRITYFHGAMVRRPQIIEDIVGVVNKLEEKVRSFLEQMACYFIAQLAPKPRMYPCGNYRARMYIRMVAPKPDLSFHDGQCVSWEWFEKEPEFFCPLAQQCGAYKNKWLDGYAAAVGPL